MDEGTIKTPISKCRDWNKFTSAKNFSGERDLCKKYRSYMYMNTTETMYHVLCKKPCTFYRSHVQKNGDVTKKCAHK